MPLTGKQKHFLRNLAHHCKVSVTVGTAGLSNNVLQEIDSALQHHELLKVKLPVSSRDERRNLAMQICDQSRTELVQLIGRICVIYRAGDEPIIKLPQ
jgi:RNA-binding protein